MCSSDLRARARLEIFELLHEQYPVVHLNRRNRAGLHIVNAMTVRAHCSDVARAHAFLSMNRAAACQPGLGACAASRVLEVIACVA